MTLRFSVVIATCNRRPMLREAVDSLLAQTEKPFEILVVDNGSTDSTPAFLRRRYGSRIILLEESRRGGPRAKNVGIVHATGDVIALLDDDAVAAADWLEKMRRCFEETGAAGVGGPALAVWESPPPAYILRSRKARSYLGVFELCRERRRLEGFHDFLIGTNCGYKREIFGATGGLIEIPWGRPVGGADLEFTQRIMAQYPIYYDPDVVVHHKISSRKATLASLAGIAFDYGIKKVAIGRRLSPRGPRDLWGIDGWISLFSGSGYLYGLGLAMASRLLAAARLLRSSLRVHKTWKVFCLMPWLGLNITPSGAAYPCCRSRRESPVGDLRGSTLREIWNSLGMRTIRGNMLAGRPSPECETCAERGSRTRLWSLVHFIRHLPRAAATPDDGFVDRFRMPYVNIAFSNLCNFRCRMCHAGCSSGWYPESRRLSGGAPAGLVRPTEDPEGLWRQLEPLLPSLEEISFSGGEPLLADEHYRVLDRLIQLRRFHVKLKYNTNLSVIEHRGRNVLRLWDRFERVEVMASLDASGRRGEYLRKGLVWEQSVANRRRMREECPRADFGVAATLSAMNALHLPDFHRECVESGFIALRGMRITFLRAPEEYQARMLPRRLRLMALAKYREHIERFIRPYDPLDRFHPRSAERSFKAAGSFLDTAAAPRELAAFRAKTRELDLLRGEDFIEVFPELADLMGERAPDSGDLS